MATSYIESLIGEREKILHVARQHLFILFSSIFVEVFTILVILAAVVLAVVLLPSFPTVLVVVIGFAILLIPIISMMRDILIFSNHEYIITNLRVIQIAGIVNKQVTDFLARQGQRCQDVAKRAGARFQLRRHRDPDRQRAGRQPVQAHR